MESAIEECFEKGWSDGLPVVPPARYLVDKMLDAMGWSSSEIVGSIKAQGIDIEAEQLASTAVMAGCRPEYARVLRPLAEAILDERFGVDGVEVTTGGVAVLAVVSGPVVAELGFVHGANALGGANSRVNATIGRYAQMVRYFCGGLGGAMTSHGTMGHPGRLSFLIAERPERVWPAFHTQNGLDDEESAVTVWASEGPNSVNNHYGNSPESLLDTIADCLAHSGSTGYYWQSGKYLVVIGPGHAEIISTKFSRDEVRQYLFNNARRPTDDLVRLGRIPAEPRPESKVEPGTMRSPMNDIDQLYVLESGAAGGLFSAVIPGWIGALDAVSKRIED